MRENSGTGILGLPRRFSDWVRGWDPVSTVGFIIVVIVLSLMVFLFVVLSSSDHKKKVTITQSQPEPSTTVPGVPQHLDGTEYLVTYQGRDLHCLFVQGESVPYYMSCDWQRWYAEGGPILK